MTPFLSKISGNFDGLFGIFFGKDGVTLVNQAYDLGLTKKYKMAGDGSITEPTNLPAQGNKVDGFIAINRYIPVFQGPLDTPSHHKFFDEAKKRLVKIDPSGPAARQIRAVELRSPERDEDRHGEVEVRQPQGHHEADRGAGRSRGQVRATTSRKATRRCARKTTRPSSPSSSSRSRTGPTSFWRSVPKDKTIVPPACKFPAA